MLNLSITSCSFYLKKSNTIGKRESYFLNKTISTIDSSGKEINFKNAFGLFKEFFKLNGEITDDPENQRAFKCTYNSNDCVETDEFIMYPILINSGVYGSESDIIDIETNKIQYIKRTTDVDFRQFYFMIVFPKDNSDVSIQKGMFIFQNIGPYGIKTFITQKIHNFLSSSYNITLNCSTIAPSLFIKKVLNDKTIKQIIMIKNYKSADSTDNYSLGYGQEIRTISKLNFSEQKWIKLKESMMYVAGAKDRIFEFDNKWYDGVKVHVDIGGRKRIISLNNIENVSIIESLPENIRAVTGNPDKKLLIEYLKIVINEYLKEMVLTFQ